MNNTIFDDVFRTMIEKMPYLAVPLINEVFHTSYSEDVKITQLRNEHQQEDGEIITDSCLLIGKKMYHIECQSTDDVTMAIRMIEYDFAIGIEHAEKQGRGYRIEFPKSCVLFLRSSGNTPDYLKADVVFPDGNTYLYSIPTIKLTDYTKDSIFEKNLLMLLPFYIMRYEKDIHEMSENPEMFQSLLNDYEEIRINLEREIGAKSMETISAQTEALWNKELSVIDLPGATEQDKIVFYTALYHSFLLPRSLSEDGKYRSPFDGKVHKGISFTDYSIWDTFRATHPLFVLLKPDFAGDLITGLLHAYDEGGWLPKWPNPGYTNCMMGTHSDAIIADAYVKGVRNFDVEKAKKAVLKNAYEKGIHIAGGRLGIMDYERLGYVPVDKYGESVARTMEFAYDDYCLSRFFAEKGEPDLSDKLGKRSKNFRNVLDKETKMVRARKADGSWSNPEDYDISVWSGFNPKGVYNYKKNYTLFVPHDVPELIRFLGGTDSLAVFMDELFDKDIYYVGDEFVMHAPYMYNLCKRPWMTQKRIYDIVNKYYLPTPSGLPGNDDCGQLSSWYIFSAMGFYPMCPASIEYQLGVPCLPGFVLHLPQNRTFTIKTKNFGKGNCYVRAVYLNGKPHRSSVITHSDIINGGEILFELTDKPAYNWFQ